MVVEGRGGSDWLKRIGNELRDFTNIHIIRNSENPRWFYKHTRILIVPSIFQETFGRVAAEGMINGIPVIGSNRGALPEVMGDAGVILDIPEQYTPTTRNLPTDKEVQPWCDTIISLWDNEKKYDFFSRQGRDRAERWRSEHVAKQYDETLSNCLRY